MPLKNNSYILHYPFKGNTYSLDFKKEAEDGFKILHDEDRVEYEFTSDENEANFIIIVVPMHLSDIILVNMQ